MNAPARPGERLVRALVGIAAVTAITMLAAAVDDRPALVTRAAAAFALSALIAAAIYAWQALAAAAETELGGARAALIGGGRLAATAYGWGAVTMQGLYLTPLTGLKWQHGWQYALAMALLAGLSVIYVRRLRDASRGTARTGWLVLLGKWLAAVQVLVAGGGLVALVVTGKLGSIRADWAANRVFVGLALAVLAISLSTLAAATHDGPGSREA